MEIKIKLPNDGRGGESYVGKDLLDKPLGPTARVVGKIIQAKCSLENPEMVELLIVITDTEFENHFKQQAAQRPHSIGANYDPRRN